MKALNLILIIFLTVELNVTTIAQTHDHSKMNQISTKTETFKVYGNCGMCKDRIEKAVKEEGAVSASWDIKTKMLTVTYPQSKTDIESLSKKLASVGHDTEKYKAPDEVYSKLPGCCHYERAK